jgi:predicted peptidase
MQPTLMMYTTHSWSSQSIDSIKQPPLLCVAIAILTLTFTPVRGSEPNGKTGQKPARLNRAVNVQMGYLLYLPENYEQEGSWPLLLFLHGSGERGTDLQLVKKHGPPKLIEAGKQFAFIVVSPQCPKGQWWQPVELTALLDEIVEKYKVDQDRIYVTGLSMGGFGTWSLAAYAPNRLAAIAPICGGGETYWTQQFSHLPVWVFHGAQDNGVPLQRSEEMVESLKRHGGNVKLTVYPDAGHDSWTATYDNPEFYEWLLEQKRATQE